MTKQHQDLRGFVTVTAAVPSEMQCQPLSWLVAGEVNRVVMQFIIVNVAVSCMVTSSGSWLILTCFRNSIAQRGEA